MNQDQNKVFVFLVPKDVVNCGENHMYKHWIHSHSAMSGYQKLWQKIQDSRIEGKGHFVRWELNKCDLRYYNC